MIAEALARVNRGWSIGSGLTHAIEVRQGEEAVARGVAVLPPLISMVNTSVQRVGE